MNFDPVSLKEKLEATGLPHNSMPYIHGCLTARAIINYNENPFCLTAGVLSLIFKRPEHEFPRDPDLVNKMNLVVRTVKDVLNGMMLSMADGTYRPYFDGPPREWCRGFRHSIVQERSRLDGLDISPRVNKAVNIIIFGAAPVEFLKANGLTREDVPETTELLDDLKERISKGVFDIYDHFRRKKMSGDN